MADFAQLQSDIVAWIENESAELSASIPTIMEFGQRRCARELQVRQFNQEVSGTLSIGAPQYPQPANLVAMKAFQFSSPTGVVTLRERTTEWIQFYWPDTGETATPRYYSVYDATNFLVAPTPSAAYSYLIRYRGHLPLLSAEDPTNWLTEYAYDALLYACLREAAVFVMDDRQNGLISIYDGKWAEARDQINKNEAQVMRDDYRVPGALSVNVG